MDFHPPEELRGTIVTLRRYRRDDGGALKDAIIASFESLRAWMPWAQSAPTDDSVMAFLEPSIERFGGDAAANYAMTLGDSGQFVGGCGLMPRVGPTALEIGYWVHAGYHRRGIATEAARMLTNAGLAIPGVLSIEIHCDAGNIASASVARTLGFQLDRVMPDTVETADATGRLMVWIRKRPA